jgi:hypothetical protein
LFGARPSIQCQHIAAVDFEADLAKGAMEGGGLY